MAPGMRAGVPGEPPPGNSLKSGEPWADGLDANDTPSGIERLAHRWCSAKGAARSQNPKLTMLGSDCPPRSYASTGGSHMGGGNTGGEANFIGPAWSLGPLLWAYGPKTPFPKRPAFGGARVRP